MESRQEERFGLGCECLQKSVTGLGVGEDSGAQTGLRNSQGLSSGNGAEESTTKCEMLWHGIEQCQAKDVKGARLHTTTTDARQRALLLRTQALHLAVRRDLVSVWYEVASSVRVHLTGKYSEMCGKKTLAPGSMPCAHTLADAVCMTQGGAA